MHTRGWRDIGYHYVIERGGVVKPGRPLEETGAHCEGHNASSIGICLVGTNSFGQDQLDALKALINALQEQIKDISVVRGHREFDTAIMQGKTCPSDMIMSYLHDQGLHK
jgi:N-acetyl-anhydromuramyl-L-alanine amidase AmpD